MKRKELVGRISGTIAAIVLAGSLLTVNTSFAAAAEEADNVQYIYTDYADLWTSDDITAEAGRPVKWYVVVPDDVTPKGCRATVKIPGLGFGTDTYNRDEGHIVLQQGENFIYEFTPEEEGDILFTCWMGSGCHKNYIHVTPAPVPEPDPEPEDSSSVTDEQPAPEDSSSEEDTTGSSAAEDSSSSDAVTPADNSSAADSDASAADSSDTSDAGSSSQSSSSSNGGGNGGNGGTKTDGGSNNGVNAPKVEGNPKTGRTTGGIFAATVLLGGALYVVSSKDRR